MATVDSRFPYSKAPLRQVKAIQFGVLSPDIIRAFSVTKSEVIDKKVIADGINEPATYDNETGQNLFGGLNDPRMGTIQDPNHVGYFGHIVLDEAVYHIGYIHIVIAVLRCVSRHSGKLLISTEEEKFKQAQRKKGAKRLAAMSKICGALKKDQDGNNQPRYSKSGLKVVVTYADASESATGTPKSQLYARDAYQILSRIKDEDVVRLGLNPKYCRPEWLVFTVIPVPPPHVRPSIDMGASQKCEDDLTHKLAAIVKANNAIRFSKERGETAAMTDQLVDLLQYHVATFFDNQIAGIPQAKQKSGKPLKTLRQRIVGKEGRVRGNLMGKRVDFSARTVITADPNLSIDQVGVPRSIALNLTVPETVTDRNMSRLRKLIENGPETHPGARYIVRSDGTRTDLRYARKDEVRTIKKGWVVERHLSNDDVVLFNRQPSLHKMSIMGHRVRVFDWSTFRLNLSVTTPYNADFDGDEMNLHVPQSIGARAEAEALMMVNKCIVSPQSNRPVMGIVQDALLSSFLMTKRSTFIGKDVMMNILMWIDDWDGRIPIPAVMIPVPNRPGEFTPYWTGKQIFSLILPKVNVSIKANLCPDDEGVLDLAPTDTFVLIEKGKILSGTVDAKTLGRGSGGVVHIVFNELGPERARILLNQVQKVANYWILHTGFTVGLGDTVANPDVLKAVAEIIDESKTKVAQLVQQGQKGELPRKPGMTMIQAFEDVVNKALNKARDSSGKRAQQSVGADNAFNCTVTAGSKGNLTNISQIMACVGQQNVEGKRIPYGFKRRTLPHFTRDDLGSESRGFVENSYLKGLTPQEFFFHAMGGREGLIDTACKTAETGYIQRRLVKALESISVRYDGTVRSDVDDVVQFLYGEDGMDGASIETQTLSTLLKKKKDMEETYWFDVDKDDFGFVRNRPYMEPSVIEEMRSDSKLRELLKEEYEQLLQDKIVVRKINGAREPADARLTDDKIPLPVNISRMILNIKNALGINKSHPSDLHPRYVIERVRDLLKRCVVVRGDDPLSIEAQENATLLFKVQIRSTLASKEVIMKHRLTKVAFDQLLDTIYARFNQSFVNPGEMVGVLAAQSIGEPATQMTLNTFHHAGNSAKNVTLGVPRLKEIINIAKTVKTPSLTVYLEDEYARDKVKAEKLCNRMEYTTLSDITIESALIYDPVIKDEWSCITSDKELVKETMTELEDDQTIIDRLSPWVLRLVLDKRMEAKSIQMADIKSCIRKNFGDDLYVMHSVDNADELVLRIQFRNKSSSQEDESKDDEDAIASNDKHVDLLMKVETELLYNICLCGVENIKKTSIREEKVKVWDDNKGFTDVVTHLIDTEGTNLFDVMCLEGVDYRKTVSNDIVEIMNVLGIEAVRRACLNELRSVISFDGSYVNYRHLAILVDTMTYRGHLMAISRHGINRTDSGPLMRCSFEETVEILLDAAAFALKDNIKGVSENIILGQLAPVGTGSFGLLIDEDLMEKAIIPIEMQTKTEVMDADAPWVFHQTPYPTGSPSPSSASPVHYAITPGPNNHSQFTPGPLSPESSGYMRDKGAGGFSPSSPAYSPSSPAYSPSSPAYSPSSPAYSPSSPAYSPSSPAYSPSSPAYSPSSPAYSPSSPAYSPSSPAYSPSSPAYSPSSPAYSPSSPAYSPSSPAYSPSSPAYSPSSPAYSPSSPAYSPSSPAYSPSSPAYSPSSPAYSPSSPAYSPSSPAYSPSSPAYSPSSPAYSPSSPAYSPGASATQSDNKNANQGRKA